MLKNNAMARSTMVVTPTFGITANNSPLEPMVKPKEKIKIKIIPKIILPRFKRSFSLKKYPTTIPMTKGRTSPATSKRLGTSDHRIKQFKQTIHIKI
jgi:hypothetical protein